MAPRNLCWFLGALLFLVGCSAKHYRRAADKEVYSIVQQVEQQVFGHTNAFSIDTPYSGRKPAEIEPAELIEDRSAKGERSLTIEQALELAVSNSRRYQSQKENLYLSALSLTGERYAFGPQFFANTAATFRQDQNRGDNSLRIQSDAGVSQLLKSGGVLSLNLANDILRYYTGDPRRSVISLLSVNLTQPLLRGFGRNNPAVERLTQAERNVVYAVRNFGFFQDEFALEVVSDYFGLLAQKDVIRNRYTNYLGRVQSTKRLEARAKDRERSSDVDQARQAELTAKNNYVNAVAGYRNSLDQFKIKLGLTIGDKVFLDDSALKEVEALGLVPAPLDTDAAYRVAVERQLPILNAIDRFEDQKRKIRVAANQFLPGLNLTGGAALESDRPTDYTKFDLDGVRTEVGLQLELPLDRLNERNIYRATLVSFESELRNLTLTLDELRDSIDRGTRTLEQRRQNYEIQKNALALANRRVISTTLLLEAGRAEIRDLVEAQDAQIAAQNALTVALVDHQQARLQLMLDIGALQTEQPKFWLQDHVAGYLPGDAASSAQTAVDSEQAVLPPEKYF